MEFGETSCDASPQRGYVQSTGMLNFPSFQGVIAPELIENTKKSVKN